jgi:Glycosyltransferase family 10 (fucosyltransferase) C-term
MTTGMDKRVIGMVTSYPGVNQCDWLWKQTPHALGVWGNIRMLAHAEQPDFLLLYNYNFQGKTYTPKSRFPFIGRGQKSVPSVNVPDFRGVPKERVIFLLREPPLEEVIGRAKADYEHAQTYCGYVSGPDDFAPTPNYMPAIWYVNASFVELDQMPIPEKVRPCSWITSGIDRTVNHRKRLDFLRLLQTHDMQIDVYGRGLPQDVKSFGQLGNKWHGVAPYYYNLAVENYADNDWYVSEKLWDSLLAWCLPIYYGGPAADRLLPPGSFLRLPSMDEKGLAYIREVIATPDAWYAAKEAIAEARQIILHKLNLLEWISNFVENASE